VLPPVEAPPSAVTQAEKAATQLEAFFLRRMLAEARPAGGGALSGGFAGDTFREMLDGALADTMAESGGIGLAEMFQGQLEAGGTAAAQPMRPLASRGIHAYAAGAGAGAGRDAVLDTMPLQARQSSGYGERTDPLTGETKYHAGLDLAAPAGTTVHAAGPGRVSRAESAGTYGNLVVIEHANGLETRYAHLQAIHVKEGDEIEAGTDVGAVGTTGRSTGPHLHFEVRRDGTAIDPRTLLPGLNTGGKRTTR
jgi:murein DD-endopeptidase MepM/ murein hydrolase activator NlpD